MFLVSVLTIGAIAAATSVSLFLLGWAQEQNGYVLMQSSRAYEYAQSCMEDALLRLHDNVAYAGNEQRQFTYGTCTVDTLGGSGAYDRTLCVSGQSGQATRRLEVQVEQVYPVISIEQWREVAAFSLCP